jgi:hypothetical protein
MSRGNISSRLEKLEASARSGPSGRCPECGLAPDEQRPFAVIEQGVPWKGSPDDPHECCVRCSLQLYTVIEVVYDSPAGEEGEGARADA